MVGSKYTHNCALTGGTNNCAIYKYLNGTVIVEDNTDNASFYSKRI